MRFFATMPKKSKTLKVISVFGAVLVAGYLFTNFISGSGSAVAVPADFSAARLQSASIGQAIVNLSNKSGEDLALINELDSKKQLESALALSTQVAGQNLEIRNQAVLLSKEMEKMTVSISAIESARAREAALQSISSRLAMISRLINYSAYLDQLVQTLRTRFSGGVAQSSVATLIEQINVEVKAVNDFNDSASKAMEEFDKLTK